MTAKLFTTTFSHLVDLINDGKTEEAASLIENEINQVVQKPDRRARLLKLSAIVNRIAARRATPRLSSYAINYNKLASRPRQSQYRISLATSVFNRFWQLQETLPLNVAAATEAGLTDLTIVDFGGEDSKEIEEFINDNFQLELCERIINYHRISKPWESFHMSAAKNIAATLTRGDFIFSLDADNFINRDDLVYIKTVIAESRYPSKTLIHQTTNESSPIFHEMWKDFLPKEIHSMCHDRDLQWDGSTGRIGASRNLFYAVGGYNENMSLMGMDDIDFLLRCLKLGSEYKHFSLANVNKDSVFIDQGSANEAHKHSNNDQNWAIMKATLLDHSLSSTKYTYGPDVVNPSSNQISDFTKSYSCCLFMVCFKIDRWVERAILQIDEIANKHKQSCILLVSIAGTNSESTINALNNLESRISNVRHVQFSGDKGLYDTWNIIIRNICSEYIGNLNPDDFRPSDYHLEAIRLLESDLADIVYPYAVPSSCVDPNVHHQIENGTDSAWFKDLPDSRPLENNHHLYKQSYVQNSFASISAEHLFQISPDLRVESYTIPNASALWRRAIHQSAGYFQESVYGAYADLALWCKAIDVGFRLVPAESYALFYHGSGQAHKLQDSNYLKLGRLVLKYGNSKLKECFYSSAFDMRLAVGSYGDHHLKGWNWVRDSLETGFLHNQDGILLDLFVERTFFWDKRETLSLLKSKPWIGFVHTTFHDNPYYSGDASNLLSLVSDERFLQCMNTCLGLITLSRDNSKKLEEYLSSHAINCKVYTIFHPIIPMDYESQPEASAGCRLTKPTALFHAGIHLRDFGAFLEVDAHDLPKTILIPPGSDPDVFIRDTVLPQSGLQSVDQVLSKVPTFTTASNEDYQRILMNDIVFNRYVEPAGSNLISESVSAKSLLILNRHPAFAEVLGVDYPLFYDTLLDASDLIKRLVNEDAFVRECRKHMELLQGRYSISLFIRSLKLIAADVVRSLERGECFENNLVLFE